LIFGCGEEKITEPEAEFQLAPLRATLSDEFIPPNGGEIKLNDGSKLIIPEGALGDSGEVLGLLNQAEKILAKEEEYVKKRLIEDENLLKSVEEVNEEIDEAIERIRAEEYEKAIKEIEESLEELDEVDEYVDDLLEKEEISDKDAGKIKDYNKETRETLESTISLPYCLLGTVITVNRVADDEYKLAYEFGPSGLIFNYAVPFEVPSVLLGGDGVNISKNTKLVVFYSQDGKKKTKIKVDYNIDEDKGIVTYYLPHFTYYYFPW